MKTIDEIISRKDYVRMNMALEKRVEEIADLINGKMKELQIKGCKDYRLVRGKECLWYDDGGYGCAYKFGLMSIPCTRTNYRMNLHLLNNAQDVFRRLSEAEDAKCKQITEALEKTSNII